MMYLVESQMGLVKIGYSVTPEARTASIQAFSPSLCRLIAKWPAERKAEYLYHRRFASVRAHSEWFSVAGEFADFVAEMRGVGVDSIPDWDALGIRIGDPSPGFSARAKAKWADPEWRELQAQRRAFRKALKQERA